MKKHIYALLLSAGLLALAGGCSKDDVKTYNPAYDGVRFPYDNVEIKYLLDNEIITTQLTLATGSNRCTASYSFIEDPLAEETTISIPLVLVGKTTDYDRTVDYEVQKKTPTENPDGEQTPDSGNKEAPEGSYELLDAVIPANSQYGFLRIKLKNVEELAEKTYQLNIGLKASEMIQLGARGEIPCQLTWNASLPLPPDNNTRRSYNMLIAGETNFISTSINSYSTAAHKAIIAVTGWDYWDDRNKAIEIHGTSGAGGYNSNGYKYLPKYNYLYLNDTYKAVAAMVADYITAYNAEHPGKPLLHNGGKLNGQPVEARKY